MSTTHSSKAPRRAEPTAFIHELFLHCSPGPPICRKRDIGVYRRYWRCIGKREPPLSGSRHAGHRADGGALAKVYGTAGICYDVKLSSDELAVLRGVVTESWLNAIGQVAPDKVEQFRELGIDNYHHLSHLLDHARLWTTHTRTLTAEQVDVIRPFDLFRSI